ncbi:CAP domain-containing protein [Halorussus sp. MSC15.2]|nr:CAP domain-containing protein [Halorussus sp. MSC15.2]
MVCTVRELLLRIYDRSPDAVTVGIAVVVLSSALLGATSPAIADSIDGTDSIESSPESSKTVIAANQSGSDAATRQANETTQFSRERVRRLVHRFVNRERAQRGLDPLALNETLSRIERYHSRDMAESDYFAHVSPGNETLTDRYDRFGFECRVSVGENRYATGAENIAYTYYEESVDVGNRTVTYSTPKQLARGIVAQWMNSSSHRKNLLRPYWRREGIGIATEETPTGTRVYVTQNFC